MTREDLRADCSRCVALCCVALFFERSPDFGCSKAPGTPCRHLAADHRCTIHERRAQEGFPGCIAYDCYGAGQHVTGSVLRGASWRDRNDIERISAIFATACEIHEMLAMLDVARELPSALPLREVIDARMTKLAALRDGDEEKLAAIDTRALARERDAVESILVVLRARHAAR